MMNDHFLDTHNITDTAFCRPDGLILLDMEMQGRNYGWTPWATVQGGRFYTDF